MGIPKKALRKSQLIPLVVDSAVSDGSHQITRVEFEENEVRKKGFYKIIDPQQNYPELLALMSVATSAFKRSFQGNNAAEERLVFDENDKLVGTLSIAIEGFIPLHFAYERPPSELQVKELVIPSTRTLIEKNFVEILFGRYFLDDDDSHPHNLGFAGDRAVDIDYDMFWYWFTIYMKGSRPVIGIPKKRINLTQSDWESFPRIKDAKLYHWPTYARPGQETLLNGTGVPESVFQNILPKSYADSVQFQQLANSVEAQEQKLAAALKILITYQPEMMRARLTEFFGSMPLNYTSLSELRTQYETEFPRLCNPETNVKPFVDFMMNLYQEHYDSLYRVVIFYMGCENNGYGVPLPATYKALYNKPSFFQKIMAWADNQNKTIYGDAELSTQFNLKNMQKRYHQIWRDAFAPSLKNLLQDAFRLTNELIKKATPITVDPSPILLTPPLGKITTDESLTNAWQLFGTLQSFSKEEISIRSEHSLGTDSKLREALLLLVDFTNEFYAITKTYYEKSCASLTEQDNLDFVQAIDNLYYKYLSIRQSLANTTEYANSFNSIASSLKQFAEQANFTVHLTTTDEQIKGTINNVVNKDLLSHTDPSIIAEFNDSLFVWAKNVKPDDLAYFINDIIDTHYAPYLEILSSRTRSSPVKDYLRLSKNERGDNRLAYILSSGKENTALNALLIEHLTRRIHGMHPSIIRAIKSGDFHTDIESFAKAAKDFAMDDSRFTHFNHKNGKILFYNALYHWVDGLKSDMFLHIVNSSLNEYENGKWWGSRKIEVHGYLNTYNNAQALAMIFINGEDTSSLSKILFQKIINLIQKEVQKNPVKREDLGYKLITQYSIKSEDLDLKELKEYSHGPSLGRAPAASVRTAFAV